MNHKTILISGAGIAGPTLAFWLKAAGFEPTLIERAPALRTGGYVIDFWGLGFGSAGRMAGGFGENFEPRSSAVGREIRRWRLFAPSVVDGVQLGEGAVRQREFGRCEILAQVSDRRGAGDQENVGRTPQQ